ncbi:MAG: lipopolysaccharide heptosyltransferase II [Verrucomicrobia bacterium]|nr:lipopolysaccharide heptosyltransferase II [Verrucomicrobiota bacterium]
MRGLKLKEEPRRIIVRMPNWIGDLVMATPVLVDLRRRFPHSEITAMCHRGLAPLLERDPHIDHLFSFVRPVGREKRKEVASIVRKLCEGHYDLGILLTNSFSSAWWFWRGSVKRRLGFCKNGRRILLSRALSFPKNMQEQHLVITYKQLLEPLGIHLSDTKPQLHLLEEELLQAKRRLAELGVPPGATIIGINPGAAYGSAKCWPPEHFRALTERLLEDPSIYPLYFGDAATSPLVKQICSGLPQRVMDVSGKTSLRELLCLIDLCDLFLTNDSGPMHIAAALETPLVAIFGSTSPTRTGPYGSGTVIHKGVSCSPCYLRECPIDFRCMQQISPEEVYQELMKLRT